MYDPWVTREMTIRDLLVHRSGLGLGAGDLLFVPRSDLTRAETMRRLRFIPPATSFRSGYAYDNVLYMVAGQLIEEVSGQTWEQFVRENVFRPDRHEPLDGRRCEPDRRPQPRPSARPAERPDPRHRRPGAARRSLEHQPQCGAGRRPRDQRQRHDPLARRAARATARCPTARRLFSEAQSREMWNPVGAARRSASRPSRCAPPSRCSSPTRSAGACRIIAAPSSIWHGGAVFGSLAAVVLLPDRNVGFYIAVNAEEGQMVRGLMYELLDHYLGLPRDSWPEKLHAFRQQRTAAAIAALQAPAAQPARVGPSLPIARYAGDYADPWYGTINIREQDGKLHVAFPHSPGLTATLDHWQYDTFKTRFNDTSMEPAYVTFQLDAAGPGRPDHDARGLAARRLQLRLSRPAVHPRRSDAVIEGDGGQTHEAHIPCPADRGGLAGCGAKCGGPCRDRREDRGGRQLHPAQGLDGDDPGPGRHIRRARGRFAHRIDRRRRGRGRAGRHRQGLDPVRARSGSHRQAGHARARPGGLGRTGFLCLRDLAQRAAGRAGAGHAQGSRLDGGDRRRRGSRLRPAARRRLAAPAEPPSCRLRAGELCRKDRPSPHPGAGRADARLCRGGEREARRSRRRHRADRGRQGGLAGRRRRAPARPSRAGDGQYQAS